MDTVILYVLHEVEKGNWMYTIIDCENSALTARDLNEEIEYLESIQVGVDTAFVRIGQAAELAQVVFVPFHSRGGIVWGGDAVWTNADSVKDTVERYLEIGDKRMID